MHWNRSFMRLPQSQANFLKQGLLKLEPTSEVYLFGSRALTSEGVTSIFFGWPTPSKVPQSRLRALRVAFFQEFGWQKLDIVNFCFSEEAPFKQIALQQAVRLWALILRNCKYFCWPTGMYCRGVWRVCSNPGTRLTNCFSNPSLASKSWSLSTPWPPSLAVRLIFICRKSFARSGCCCVKTLSPWLTY